MNLHAIRKLKQPSSTQPIYATLSIDDETPLEEQLGAAIYNRMTRVRDVFKAWDEDKDMLVSMPEFGSALSSLGIRASRRELVALFTALDKECSGYISLDSMEAQLRRVSRGSFARAKGQTLPGAKPRPASASTTPPASNTGAPSGCRSDGRPSSAGVGCWDSNPHWALPAVTCRDSNPSRSLLAVTCRDSNPSR